MLNRDRGLIQLEVDLQHGAAVAGNRRGQDAGLAFDKSVLVILGLSLIRIGSIDRAAGLGRALVGQLYVLGVALTIIILIVELDFVIYIKRFPHGVEVIIRIRFIRRNIGRNRSGGGLCMISTILSVVPQEVRCGCCICGGRIGCAGIQLIPAEELVSCTLTGRGDRDRLVDLQRIRAVAGRFLRTVEGLTVSADVFLAVAVAKPPDKGVGGLTLVGKHSLELEHIVRALDLGMGCVFPLGHSSLGVIRLDREGRSGKHGLTRLDPIALRIFDLVGAVPRFHDPVRELLALRDRAGCGLCGHACLVNIEVSLLNIFVHTAVRIDIPDADTLCAVKHFAPLSVNVKTLVDPETGCVLLDGIPNAVDAVRLGRRIDIVVRRRDVGVVQHIAGRVERARAILVKEPADEFIVVARTVWRADRAAVIDTEAHGLAGGAPVQRGVSRIHSRVHEHTDLRAVPLGVDRHAIHGHGAEGVLRGAGLVDVPAGEGIALLRGLEAGVPLRIEGIVIELGDILQVGDLLADRRAAGKLVVRRRFVGVDHVVAVVAGAVEEGDVILGSQIVEICRTIEIWRSVVRLELGSRQRDIYRAAIADVVEIVIHAPAPAVRHLVGASKMRHITVIPDQFNEVFFESDEVVLRIRGGILLELNTVIGHRTGIGGQRLNVEVEGLPVGADGLAVERNILPRHDFDYRQDIISAAIRVFAEVIAVLRLPCDVVKITARKKMRNDALFVVSCYSFRVSANGTSRITGTGVIMVATRVILPTITSPG